MCRWLGALLAIAATLVLTAAASAAWTQTSPLPDPRGYMGVAARDGVVYAAGGLTSAGFSNEFTAYTEATHSWSALASLPTARGGLALVAARNGRIYAIGGDDGAFGTALATVEAYSIATHSWTTVAPLPAPRTGLSAVEGNDGRIYAFDGQWQGDGGDYHNSVYAYDPASDTWQTMNSNGFSPRYYAAATKFPDGRIGVFGGWNNLLGGDLSIAEAYDPATDSWATLPSMPTARQGPVGFTGCDGSIQVAGGGSNGDFTSVDVFQPAVPEWVSGASMLGPHTVGGAAVTLDGTAFVVGGYDGYDDPAFYRDTVEQLDTRNGAWCGTPEGFETGSLGPAWTATSLKVQTGSALTGGYGAASVSTGKASDGYLSLPSPRTEVFTRTWIRVSAQNSKPVTLLAVGNSTATVASLVRNGNGTLVLHFGAKSTTRTSKVTLGAGSWHSLELHVRTGTGGLIEVWLDGAPVAALTGAASLPAKSPPLARVQVGDTTKGHTWNISYDDLAAAPVLLGQ
jgi:N-acetylneuraminic acid mutarotase